MAEITYWQGRTGATPTMLADPAPGQMPQDEATAAVVIAAILARNIADGRWPGEYSAHVSSDTAAEPVLVNEDDPRVAVARKLLISLTGGGYFAREYRDFTAQELTRARQAVLTMPAT